METIIKKAIEGGYIPTMRTGNAYRDGKDLVKVAWLSGYTTNDYEIVLDPLFWQALGKACGWFEGEVCDSENRCVRDDEWIKYALKFHEINLTQSWDKAIEYLESIITNK